VSSYLSKHGSKVDHVHVGETRVWKSGNSKPFGPQTSRLWPEIYSCKSDLARGFLWKLLDIYMVVSPWDTSLFDYLDPGSKGGQRELC
jgi:hypothetical protein